jgi:hypothetical protein
MIGDKKTARIKRLEEARAKAERGEKVEKRPTNSTREYDRPSDNCQPIPPNILKILQEDGEHEFDGDIDKEGYIVIEGGIWPGKKAHHIFDTIADDLLKTLPESTLQTVKEKTTDEVYPILGSYIRGKYGLWENPATKRHPAYASHWVLIKLKRLLVKRR